MRALVLAAALFAGVVGCDYLKPPQPATTTFDVEGMTCESCVEGITKTLALAKGVQSIKVDLELRTAVVVHDPELMSATELEARIDRMGYEATVREAAAPES